MRNRKYVEIETGYGQKYWAGAALNKKEINKIARAIGSERLTGRAVTLDTDFAVQGDEREWDREAAARIGKQLGETVKVERL